MEEKKESGVKKGFTITIGIILALVVVVVACAGGCTILLANLGGPQ